MNEERLMKTPEEVRKKAVELLQMPKEDLLTNYMFMEQEIEQLKEEIKTLYKYTPEKGFRLVGDENVKNQR